MLVKTFVIFFTTLLLSNVFAVVSHDDTWSSLVEAKERGEITFENPEYLLNGGFFYKATDICLSGVGQKVIKPIKIKARKKCLRRRGKKCLREVMVYPKLNILGKRFGCLVRKDNDPSKRCFMYGSVPFVAQTTFSVNVFKVDGGDLVPLFDKELKLPSCKDKE